MFHAVPQQLARPVGVVPDVDVAVRVHGMFLVGHFVVRGQVGAVAMPAVHVEQHASFAGLGEFDRTEQGFGPARRLQLRERALDLVQTVRMNRRVVAQVQRQWRAILVEQLEAGADAERLIDVARHRLGRVSLPLHPVELRDVPEVRVADRRGGRPVVVRRDVPAEHRVRDALRRVGAAVAFEHRVIAVLEVGPRVRQQLADRLAELFAQFASAASKSNPACVPPVSVGSITLCAKRSNFHGFQYVASIESIRSAWNWPGFMSVTACIACPPSMRIAVPW